MINSESILQFYGGNTLTYCELFVLTDGKTRTKQQRL